MIKNINGYLDIALAINGIILIVAFIFIEYLGKKIKYKYELNLVEYVEAMVCFSWMCILFCLLSELEGFDIWMNSSMWLDFSNINYINDKEITKILKIITLILGCICTFSSIGYAFRAGIKHYEYIILVYLAMIGIIILISSTDFVYMVLGIELQSLCFYGLINLKLTSTYGNEAGLKYFINGIFLALILIMGCFIIWGSVGSLNFEDLSKILQNDIFISEIDNMMYMYMLIGIICIYCGILFKLAVAPFHGWICDIYEAAPINIIFFFAIVPQLSILITLVRLNQLFLVHFEELFIFILFLSITSITVGTFGAINQTKLKRIIAYSSVSNMGYILISFLGIESIYLETFFLYWFSYTVIILGLWIILINLWDSSIESEVMDLYQLMLVYRSNKILGIIFVFFLFSSMGIPPFVGFFAKFFILYLLISSKMYLYSFFLIIVNSIGIIYYLWWIKQLFSLKAKKILYLLKISENVALVTILLFLINICILYLWWEIFILMESLIFVWIH